MPSKSQKQSQTQSTSDAAAPIYTHSAPLLTGRTLSLSEFRGSVMLIVNTASLCGFTSQYKGLEALYSNYHDRGFQVLAFPCNQFGGQEPGTDEEIGSFCQRKFAISFPVFAKIDVNGPNAHPLYLYLKKQKPGIAGFLTGGRIGWNFTKFLVDRTGKVVGRYGPARSPESMRADIENLLP